MSYQPPVMPGYSSQPPPVWPPQQPAPRKSRTVPILVGVLVAAVIAVVGLTAVLISQKRPAGTARPVAAATVAKATVADYDSAQRLAGALNENGIACGEWESVDNPINAIDLGNCFVLTDEVVVAIHADHAEAAGEPAYLAALTQGTSDVNVVVGSNWTLSCDSAALCKRISKEFGGTYVHLSA